MADHAPSYRVEPDGEFANRLERELLERLAAARSTAAGDPADATLAVLETARDLHGVRAMSIDGRASEPFPTATATRHRRWRTVTGVAAAVLLIVVGAVVVVARNDSSPETSVAVGAGAKAVEAEEVARGFLDAYGAFDADRAMTFLTKRALAAGWGTPAKFRRELSLLQASGWKQTIGDPAMPAPPPGSDGCNVYDFVAPKLAVGRPTVHCSYAYYGLRSDEIGRGPYGAYWAIIVDKDRIVSAENRIDTGRNGNGFDDEVWRPFRRWVSSAYPHDAAAMYQGSNRSDWKRSQESVRLWEQHTREYVSIGVPYLARAEAICTAAHDRLKNMSGPPPVGPPDSDASEAYDAMSARVLEEALAELRAVPPPEAFRVQFQQAYKLGDLLVQELRGDPAAWDPNVRHGFGGQPGLHECTFDLPG